jgi:hypothetical protein
MEEKVIKRLNRLKKTGVIRDFSDEETSLDQRLQRILESV